LPMRHSLRKMWDQGYEAKFQARKIIEIFMRDLLLCVHEF
jgi:hypothetical protein